MTTESGRVAVEWDEVQRVLLRGYVMLRWAHFLLLRVTAPSKVSPFIRALIEQDVIRFGWHGHRDGSVATHLAFTHEGLQALGVDEDTLSGFSPEFLEGMSAEARARKMRDVGDSEPTKWLWGYAAGGVHLVLMMYAESESLLASAVASHRASLASFGLEEVTGPSGESLGAAHPLAERREHFGFTDGIVQPRFRDEPAGVRTRSVREADKVAAGELLLGYVNEADILPRSPVLSKGAILPDRLPRKDGDFGKNGSYLVFRQLEQDVGAFWRAMACIRPEPSVADRVLLAAKMVGRWPDGAPLVTTPYPGAPAAADPEAFDYARDDPHGDRCPLGAHIRRANPRATLSHDPDTGLAKSKKHRILRRGRSYGEPFVRHPTPEEFIRAAESGTGAPGPRGLHFMCFNADIANQFEFVQQTWLNGKVFQGLHEEVDPLTGDPSVTSGRYSIPSEPLRRIQCLDRFVAVRGGAYFFLPSRAALTYLSALGGAPARLA